MKNIIAAVVGMCGTGKSVVSGYVQDTFGFKCVYFGGFVLEEVKKRGLEINSTNEKIVREDLRAKHGPAVMAKLAIDSIDSHLTSGSYVIIDGLYSFSEYLYLKEKFSSQLVMIAIHTARHIRYQRLGSREVRPLSPAEVDQRDLNEIQNIEKAGPIAIADYHIVNDGELQELHSRVHQVFEELLQQTGLSENSK